MWGQSIQPSEISGGTDTLVSQITALTSAVATLQDTVNDLASAGSGISSCIRHIQRGTTIIAGSSVEEVTLSGFTDVDKMIVLLNGTSTTLASNTVAASLPYLEDLTTTVLSLRKSGTVSSSYNISYQVIEFY